MITRDDIQSWLDRLEGGSLQVSEIEPNIWRCCIYEPIRPPEYV